MKQQLYIFLITTFLAFFSFENSFAQENKNKEKEEKAQKLPASKERCDMLNDIAEKYTHQDAQKAYLFAREALTIADSLAYNRGRARAYRNQGIVFFIRHDFHSALEVQMKSLELFELERDSLEINLASVNIGNTYRKLTKFTDALDLYEKSNLYFQAKRDTARLISNWINVGLCDYELEKYESALSFFQKALDFTKKYYQENKVPEIYRSMGSVYQAQKLFEKALSYYNEAKALDESSGNKRGLAEDLNKIGRLKLKMTLYLEGYDAIKESLKLATEVGDVGLITDNTQGLGEFYESVDDYQNALDYFKKFKYLSDSLRENQKYEVIATMQDRFNSERKDKEIAQLNKKKFQQEKSKQQQTFVIIGLTVAIAIVLGVLFILYKNNRLKHRVNSILSRQKEEIQKKNEAIMSSLQYAQRIQSAIHPAEKKMEEILGELFVLYKPKDIVSGDFYWVGQTGEVTVVAAVDCTGHGVPGAFMSMIGGSLLRQIIMERGITNPAEILVRMDSGVRKFLRQEETQNRDGMDMGLCVVDKNNGKLHFCGAKNPCLYVYQGKIEEVKGSKQAVGGAVSKKLNDPFKTTSVDWQPGMFIYLLSDGFQDQFGGTENKKYGFSNLKRLLASLAGLPAHEQKEELEKTFDSWKGIHKQIDDVLIFGFRT